MFQRLATQLRQQLKVLVDEYDARLRTVPGYANLPESARRDLEQHVLQIMATCLDSNDASPLIQYIRERAEQVLTHGFQPEWFQQAVLIPQEIVTPLVETVAESNFVWHTLSQAQTTAWEIVAQERRRIEQTLRESETRYQTIFDATPIMFWLKDTHNRTLRINKAAAAFEGSRPEEVEGKSAYEIYPREQAEAFYQDDLEVIRSNRPKFGIIEQHTAPGTGKSQWVETGKTPVHNEQGEVVGVLAFAIDVTERKRAEEERRAALENEQIASERLRAIVTATDELIRTADLDMLYRRAVELARERIGVERCALYILDESREWVLGTYGTDDKGQTTNEHSNKEPVKNHEIILAPRDQQWTVFQADLKYWGGERDQVVGKGWNAATAIRSAVGPIGIMFNDAAISQKPYDVDLQQALALYCSMLANIIENKRLELRIQQSLQLRGRQVQTSTEIAQEIAAASELGDLFQRVVTLIKERFNYYHAQIFRYDPVQDAVVLVTGYGEVGKKMLTAGHRLPMGRGVVGIAASTNESILATDVRQDEDWRPNPNLPKTAGELAVPIQIGGGDAEAQLNALKHFTQSGFDGVALAPIDPVAVARLTHTAVQQGTAIVLLGGDLGPENQTSRISSADYALGGLLGVEAGTWAKQHVAQDQMLKVGIFNYRTLSNLIERENGIIDGIKSVFGEKVTVVASGMAINPATAADMTADWLRDYPDLNLIVAINDSGALGAYRTAVALGRTDPDQFFIGGIDAVPEALEAIQHGSIYQATATHSPEVIGVMAVRTLVAAAKGLAVAPQQIVTDTLVNRSNVNDFLGTQREAALFAHQNIIPAEDLASLDLSGLRLGLSVLNLSNPFFRVLAKSAQQEAERLGVQLVINDPRRVLGVLDVQSDRAGALTEDDRLLLEGLCGQIAIAIESKRLLEHTEKLYRINAELNAAHTYPEVLDILRTGTILKEIDTNISINLFDRPWVGNDMPEWSLTIGRWSALPASAVSARYALHQLPAAKLLRPDEPLIIPNVHTDPRLDEASRQLYEKRLQAGSTFFIPLVIGSSWIGYINAVHSQPRQFDNEDMRELMSVVGQAIVTIQSIKSVSDLAESEARYRQILDGVRDMILVKGEKSRIVWANKAFRDYYGMTIEALQGLIDAPFAEPDYTQQYVKDDQYVWESGQLLHIPEEPVKRHDGEIRLFETVKTPIFDENNKVFLTVGVSRDITERKHFEEVLRRNESQLSEALRIAQLANWEYDVTTDTFTFNDQFYALLRTTAEREGGYVMSSMQYAQRFVHPEDAPLVGGEVQAAIETTDPNFSRELDHRIFYADGEMGYFTVRFRIEKDAQGRTVKTYGANQDITARKVAEQVIAAEQQRIQAILGSITAPLIISRLADGEVLYANQALLEIGQVRLEDVIGHRVMEFFVDPHDWDAMMTLLQQQGSVSDFETQVRRSGGQTYWGMFSARIIDFQNEPCVISSYVDITTRRQIEQEVLRFRQGLEQSSDAVFMTDVSGHIIYVNPAFERIYGYTSQEALGQTPRILKSGQLSQDYYQRFWQALLNKQSVSGEKPNRTKTGRILIVEDSNSPILDKAGNLLGFLSTHHDITERKQAEQRMAETLHETERLYATVSHENWQAYRQTGQLGEGYVFNQAMIEPDDKVWEPEIAQALEQQSLVATRASQRAIVVSPLAVRGEAIGALGVYDNPAHPLSRDDLQLIEAVSEQVALALESARLFDQTQRDAEREHTINRVTSRIRNARSVDEVLSIAAQELRMATGASRSVVEILPAADQPLNPGSVKE